MSQYLRDEYITNINLDDQALLKINEDLVEIAKEVKLLGNDKSLIKSYVIRFDNNGFRLYDFEMVLRYFKDAHRIERVIFLLESQEAIETSKLRGESIEIWFDAKDVNSCKLVVQSDNSSWVNSTFLKLKERINKYKNKNFIIRNRWTLIIVQLTGVIIGILVSLLIAIKLSPKLQIENALAFTFVIAFLIYSNIWTFLLGAISRCLDYYWPNISFKRIKGVHWLIRALISTAFVSIFLFILNRISTYISIMLKSLWKS